MPKIIFMKYLPSCQDKIGPKTKNAQNLLKLGTYDISNKPVSILMSEIVYIKYLAIVKLKLVPKSKILRIY